MFQAPPEVLATPQQQELTPRPHTVMENDLSEGPRHELEKNISKSQVGARSVTSRSEIHDNLKKLNDVQYEASDDSVSNAPPKEFALGAFRNEMERQNEVLKKNGI